MDFNSFSVREGGASIDPTLVGSITQDIKTTIWNLVHEHLIPDYVYQSDAQAQILSRMVRSAREYLHLPVDSISNNQWDQIQELKTLIVDDDAAWHRPYDLLEFLTTGVRYPISRSTAQHVIDTRSRVIEQYNRELARAGSGYRFVNDKLAPVTSQEESVEIQSALKSRDKFHGVRTHIRAALESLSAKPDPDVRNCIEESIHAVESALKVTTSVSSGGVAKALRQFRDQHGIHPALSGAIEKLYGFASDEQGLRHPILSDTSALTAADARMMLVTASALANWIIAKDAGLRV